jgi:integrase
MLQRFIDPAAVAAEIARVRSLSAFPDSGGGVENLEAIVRHGWHPAQIAAGVTGPQGRAKYPGLHALRHFYASWCINRRADGGLELPLKVVQSGWATLPLP